MRIVLLVSILCVILGSLVSGQTATCDLSVGYFSQTTTLYQAQAQGFLSKTGISICTGAVTGSVQAYQGLASGQYHILQSATDNAVSRYYLPSAYPGQNVTLLGQMDGSALQILAVHWDIEKIEDLRGKNIVVDSPVSGLIFNLRRLLAVHNLYYPRDYNMVPLGANRFGAVQNGYLTDSNGVRIPISATVLAPPQSTQIIQNPNAYAGQVRNLGIIESDVAPVAGTSLQTDPNHLLNPVKSVNINKFMGAILLARRFVLNPANKAAVIAGLKALQPLNDAQAEVAYQYSINDKLVGETIVDLSFDRYAFGNGVFYKATFDDRYNNVNYADGFFNTGFGRLIDYGPRDAGLIIADQLAAITVSIENLPQYNNICVYPANRDYSYKVNNALSGLLSASSGGCVNLKSVFASCSTDDLTAAPIDCQYDATNDVLTINAKSTGSSRVYNVKYSVEDACQYKVLVTQTVTIYKSASDAPSGSNCVNLQPACSVTVSSRSVATWSRDGSSYAQYSLSINNPSAGNVNSVILQLSASDAANLETVWAMRSLGNNKYSLLLAGRGIAPDSTYTLAGYIAKNGPLNFSPSTVTCQ